MYEYIKGKIVEVTPSQVVIENAGIGFLLYISLNTFETIKNKTEIKLYVYQLLREDTNELFGFADKQEREVFLKLISVSGVGANTARLMLSSLKPSEIIDAILGGDVALIRSVKGIGTKTAQRIIVDLKDKMTQMQGMSSEQAGVFRSDSFDEAVAALVMLGFNKSSSEKVVRQELKQNGHLEVEEIIKLSIKKLSKG